MTIFIRAISLEDEAVLQLLHELSPTIVLDSNRFQDFVKNLPSNQSILVLEENAEIIAVGSLLVEQKLIHKFGSVGHIEDVVVSKRFQGKGYGKILMEHLVQLAKVMKCYKCILNCSSENISFYEKCGFQKNQLQMAMYF